MTWIDVLLLAVVQGIAEFLPISSSGHLVVVEDLLGIKADLVDLNIVLHLGTLAAILVVYRERILRLLYADRRLLWLVVVGTIPAVIFGLTVKLLFENWLASALLAGGLLPVTAAMLFWSNDRPPGTKECRQLTWQDAVVIGLFQAVAVLPGISRSGSTIAAGLWRGLSRDESATFAFLLAIPAIGGAGVLETLSWLKDDTAGNSLPLLAFGAVIAALVGYVSLRGLLMVLKRGSLDWFAWWCLAVGAFVVLRAVGAA